MPIWLINGVEVVECPCCKGKRVLVVYEEVWPSYGLEKISMATCTHCMGKGVVRAK